jgi:long-chain fatty acid transport protein
MLKRLSAVMIAAAVVALLPAGLGATNGYFSHGIGTQQKGMAGAGAALLFGPMDAATNPAATALGGSAIDFGAALFSPDRRYDVIGTPSGYPGTMGLQPGEVKSGSPFFPIPHLGLTRKVGRAAVLGLAMYGNGGMNTNYGQPTFGFSPVGVNLSQMFIVPNFSVKVGVHHAVGVGALIAYQRFEAKGLKAFMPFSSSAANLSDNKAANTFGGGVRVGYLGQLSRQVSVAASYQSRVSMSHFANYAGLFAEQGSFDIPSNWVLGVALKPTETVDVALDVQRVNYSRVKAVANHLLPNLMTAALGSDGGAGFGWDDVTTVKAGVQWRAGQAWTWRAGYSKGNQPVPTSEVLFNILAPGVIEQHVTAGVSRELGHGKALHLSIMRALNSEVTGANPLEAPGQQKIKLSMSQWEYEVGYSVKF